MIFLYQNEFVAPFDARREFITGFSGSAGIALVTDNKALLWTDGRYDLQADLQLDCNWQLMTSSKDHVTIIK